MAVFSAVSSIIGGNRQAKAVSSAADSAAQVQQDMYNQTREDLTPWRQQGQNALMKVANLSGANGGEAATAAMGDFTTSPGYAFRLGEGQKALDASGAARGMSLSGAQLKAANEFGQNLATQEYGNYFNRLAGVAGVGQQAANSTAAAGTSSANAQSGIAMNEGNQLSGIYAGQTQGINNGINSLFKWGSFAAGGGKL